MYLNDTSYIRLHKNPRRTSYFLLAVGRNAMIDHFDDSQIFNHPSKNPQVIQTLNFNRIHSI